MCGWISAIYQEGAYDEEEDMDDIDAAEQDLGPDLELLLAEAKEVRAQLTASSASLQKKLYTIFSNRKTTELRDAQGKLQAEGQEARCALRFCVLAISRPTP